MTNWIVNLAVIFLVGQIPLIMLSICFNRSKVVYGFVNAIWIVNIPIVIGLGILAYSQTTISSFNQIYCDHFKDANKTDNYLINKIGVENEELRNIT